MGSLPPSTQPKARERPESNFSPNMVWAIKAERAGHLVNLCATIPKVSRRKLTVGFPAEISF